MKNIIATSSEIETAPQGLLSRKQVANLFGVCKETIRRWEKDGLLKPVVINPRVLRYYVSDVNTLMVRN